MAKPRRRPRSTCSTHGVTGVAREGGPSFFGDNMEDEEVTDIWRAILMAALVDREDAGGLYLDDWDD